MLTIVTEYVKAFVYDEAAFQRYSVTLLYAFGWFLASGGVIPGTDVVIPFATGPSVAKVGEALKAGALFLAAGGRLPTPTPK